MPKFRDRVFGAPVDPDVILELEEIAGGGGRTTVRDKDGMPIIIKGEGRALEEIKPTFKKYLGDRTPFVRMWCAVNVNEFKDVPKGKDVKRMKDGSYVYMNDENPPQQVSVGSDDTSKTLVFTVNENNEKFLKDTGSISVLESPYKVEMKLFDVLVRLGMSRTKTRR